jgi:hypothetical protein
VIPEPAPYEQVEPLDLEDFDRYHDSATLGIPFWAAGLATTGWLVVRNFRDELEPLPPEVSVLAWTAGVGLGFGGAGMLDYGSLRAAEVRGRPSGAARVGLGMLVLASGLLVADAGVYGAFPDARGREGTAETIAVSAVTLGVLAGAPGFWQWVKNGRQRVARGRGAPVLE